MTFQATTIYPTKQNWEHMTSFRLLHCFTVVNVRFPCEDLTILNGKRLYSQSNHCLKWLTRWITAFVQPHHLLHVDWTECPPVANGYLATVTYLHNPLIRSVLSLIPLFVKHFTRKNRTTNLPPVLQTVACPVFAGKDFSQVTIIL